MFSCHEREGMMLSLFSCFAVLPFHLQVCRNDVSHCPGGAGGGDAAGGSAKYKSV